MSSESPAEIVTPVLPSETHPVDAFARTLYTVTPRVWVSYGMVAACLGLFLAMAGRGAAVWQPAIEDLIAWGANYPPRSGRGEWWRLVTCMFLHGGLLHLALNMWALYDAGPLVERLFGNAGFLLLYLLSGVCGSLASYVFSNGVVSVGASGAIFGIIGGLLAFTVGQRDAVPPQVLRGFRRSAILFALINGGLGFVIPHVDVAAHLGGFAGGIVCGLLLRQRFSREVVRRRWLRNLTCALAVPAGMWALWQFLPPPPPDFIGEAPRIDASYSTGTNVFNSVMEKFQRNTISAARAAEQLERESLPQIRDARQRLNTFDRWPLVGRPDLKTSKEHLRLLEDAIELYIRAFREKDATAQGTMFRRAHRRLEETNELGPLHPLSAANPRVDLPATCAALISSTRQTESPGRAV